MFGGKEDHTNIQISAEPGIEPGTLWMKGKDLIPIVPTTQEKIRTDNLANVVNNILLKPI